MVDIPNIFGTVTVVTGLNEGKRVSVTIPTAGISDTVAENRARARAMVAAGFAKEGFLRKLNIQLSAPKLERRTEIVDRFEVGDNETNYTVQVRPGVILQ